MGTLVKLRRELAIKVWIGAGDLSRPFPSAGVRYLERLARMSGMRGAEEAIAEAILNVDFEI